MSGPVTDPRAAALARLAMALTAPIGPMVSAFDLPRVGADVAFLPGGRCVLLPSGSPLVAALQAAGPGAVLPPGRSENELARCPVDADGPSKLCFPARGGRWVCPRCGRTTPVPTPVVGLRLTACGCADVICAHPVGGPPARPR